MLVCRRWSKLETTFKDMQVDQNKAHKVISNIQVYLYSCAPKVNSTIWGRTQLRWPFCSSLFLSSPSAQPLVLSIAMHLVKRISLWSLRAHYSCFPYPNGFPNVSQMNWRKKSSTGRNKNMYKTSTNPSTVRISERKIGQLIKFENDPSHLINRFNLKQVSIQLKLQIDWRHKNPAHVTMSCTTLIDLSRTRASKRFLKTMKISIWGKDPFIQLMVS